MLFIDDIHLVTKIKKNMKNSLMNRYDKLMLRKRSVIETAPLCALKSDPSMSLPFNNAIQNLKYSKWISFHALLIKFLNILFHLWITTELF